MTTNNDDKISIKDLFYIAKENRDLEIKLFWQRTNYFLLLNSAIVIGLISSFRIDTSAINHFFLAHVFSIIGIFVCIAWIKVGLGSK